MKKIKQTKSDMCPPSIIYLVSNREIWFGLRWPLEGILYLFFNIQKEIKVGIHYTERDGVQVIFQDQTWIISK